MANGQELKKNYGIETHSANCGRGTRTAILVVGVPSQYLVVDSGGNNAMRTLRTLLPIGTLCRLRHAGLLYPCRIVWFGGVAYGQKTHGKTSENCPYTTATLLSACGGLWSVARCALLSVGRVYRQHRAILGFDDYGDVDGGDVDALAQIYRAVAGVAGSGCHNRRSIYL